MLSLVLLGCGRKRLVKIFIYPCFGRVSSYAPEFCLLKGHSEIAIRSLRFAPFVSKEIFHANECCAYSNVTIVRPDRFGGTLLVSHSLFSERSFPKILYPKPDHHLLERGKLTRLSFTRIFEWPFTEWALNPIRPSSESPFLRPSDFSE